MFKMYRPNVSNAQEESSRERKKKLRRHLMIEIGRGLIASNGLRSLKVRDVAEAADCSIGSVYNEFGDFDGLILTVNRETVQTLTARLVAVPAEDPVRQLHGLAETYLTFAAEHANLLRSLFEHRMEDDRPFPEDILKMVMQAFALMHEPMVRLLPDRARNKLDSVAPARLAPAERSGKSHGAHCCAWCGIRRALGRPRCCAQA